MLKNKPTVVIGASPNADRYSNRATLSLQKHGLEVEILMVSILLLTNLFLKILIQ